MQVYKCVTSHPESDTSRKLLILVADRAFQGDHMASRPASSETVQEMRYRCI